VPPAEASEGGRVKGLRLAADFELPLDVVAEAVGIVATRGAGKSYASAVLIEEAIGAGVQVLVLDPAGVYHGLRSDAEGGSDGLAVYVLGGAHGDVALEEGAGALIADVVVESGHSFVLDLSDFGKGQARRFVADLLERLYQRKGRQKTNLMLVIDEADEFAPQRQAKMSVDSARCLGAVETVVKRGRSRGVGAVLITQRTQALNKDVLDLVDTMLAMRLGAPRSRKTVSEWLEVKEGTDEQGVIGSLSRLPTGTAWVWSPLRGLLKQVAIRRIRTFDSYQTPKPGQVRPEARSRAELDLDSLGEQMRSTVERARENDPALLRKRLADAEQLAHHQAREIDAMQAELDNPKVEYQDCIVHVPLLTEEERSILDHARKAIEGLGEQLANVATVLDERLNAISERAGAAARLEILADPPRLVVPPEPPRGPTRESKESVGVAAAESNGEVTKPQQKLLDAIAWWGSIGVRAPLRGQVAFVAGYSHPQSRGFRDPLYGLNAAGFVEYPDTGHVALTRDGERWARVPDRTPTEADLQERIFSVLPKQSERMLRLLVASHNDLTRDELAGQLGYSHSQSRGFRDPLYKLHALGLVEYPSSGIVRASDLCYIR
jgi:hypothetical protein